MAGALLAYTLTLSFQRRKSYRRIPSWNNSRARSSFIKLIRFSFSLGKSFVDFISKLRLATTNKASLASFNLFNCTFASALIKYISGAFTI